MSNQTTARPDSETLTFPPGFRWGVATASYQYEGDCENSQWRAWEKAGGIANGDSAGVACGWWRHAEPPPRLREEVTRHVPQRHLELRPPGVTIIAW